MRWLCCTGGGVGGFELEGLVGVWGRVRASSAGLWDGNGGLGVAGMVPRV